MYWPTGTPRVYAPGGSRSSARCLVQTDDGLSSPTPGNHADAAKPSSHGVSQSGSSSLGVGETDHGPPLTPATPMTPGVRSVDHFDQALAHHQVPEMVEVSLENEPVLALRVSRTGHLFVSITSTSMTVWQVKPLVVLATVVRSKSSVELYGKNVDLLLRPDSAIFVIRTHMGYLITYSIATDNEARLYKPHFSSYTNIQRRRQSHVAGPGLPADQILLGPGEGGGVWDISVRFRMVIKVDAGIESALALDEELIVATRKPPAVQCILWQPDKSGNQTRTELISKMGWLEKRASVVEMAHDRPMNLSTWITSDGKVYAVQRYHAKETAAGSADADAKRLFKGHCVHVPVADGDKAVRAVINARFSLISVGCRDGSVRVYSVRDYSGNIPPSHTHAVPASISSLGQITTLTYSPDGYCLFAGYRGGWCTWSVYGKPLGGSTGAEKPASDARGEPWLSGVVDAAWIGGGAEIMIASPKQEALWLLEMARSALTGCYNTSNLFRTVLQTGSSIMVYRGYELPDLTTISTEPFLWHSSGIPLSYLRNHWPIKCTSVSPDGRYVAVAGRRGLAHYSVNSGRWKTFTNEAAENEFQVRGGMCWYQHLLVAAVEANKIYELRLFSRETALDPSHILHVEVLRSPVVLMTASGEDSLLVYTHENVLHHFIFDTTGGTVRLVEAGNIAFNGIVRLPARVRGLSWIVPEHQLREGDPSNDVSVASVLFLVDGKLVLLKPSLNKEGHLKYDMRVLAQNVEYYAFINDQPSTLGRRLSDSQEASPGGGEHTMRRSLWVFDGNELKVWTSMDEIYNGSIGEVSKDLPSTVSIPVDFYPLSILLGKAIALGLESELVQRRDVPFSLFRFSIRTQLVLPEILRSYLREDKKSEAMRLAQYFQYLEYFSHILELLLHRVLDEEVDTAPKPEDAVLPRVLSLLSSFKDYLEIVLRCTRKTEVRQWKTLFAYLPPAEELFEESLQRGSLKTAGGYLIILHTLEEVESSSEQSVRVFSRAVKEEDWDLCKELARFLAAMDETGDTLRNCLSQVDALADYKSGDAPMTLSLPPAAIKNGAGGPSGSEESAEASPST